MVAPKRPFAAAVAVSAPAAAQQERKPNILVIMGDDVGWFNISAYHQGIMSGNRRNSKPAWCSVHRNRRCNMMVLNRTACMTMIIAGLLCMPEPVLAQTAPTTSASLKPIGGQTKPDIVPSLIVLTVDGATLQGQKLTLTGVTAQSIVFADRPVRSAGHLPTADLLEEWTANDSFGKDPPNATVSVFSKDGSKVRDAVVVLKTPKHDGEQLTFDVDVLEGNLTGADGAASVFIDIIGMPWTPMSFAGVARRTAWRNAAYYGGAYGAYGPYYHPYYRPGCGYYPYPPCY